MEVYDSQLAAGRFEEGEIGGDVGGGLLDVAGQSLDVVLNTGG